MNPGKWEVWHAIKPNFGMEDVPLEECQLVAILGPEIAEELDDVFRLTNHIEEDWRNNKEIKITPEARRSTSVGDIVIDPNGAVWRCMSCGWEQVK